MNVLKDVVATAFGIGPNYKLDHSDIRQAFGIGAGQYTPAMTTLEMYHTFPFLDYGSTIESDNRIILYRNGRATRGGSNADYFFNFVFPDYKKPRKDRSGVKLADENDKAGPRILYDYYENGSFPGARMAVAIAESKDKEYGSYMQNVKFAFKAKLNDWDEEAQEFQGIELTHLYVDGKYVAMDDISVQTALDYAKELTEMIMDENKDFDPKAAMQNALSAHGQDALKVGTWDARRQNRDAQPAAKL